MRNVFFNTYQSLRQIKQQLLAKWLLALVGGILPNINVVADEVFSKITSDHTLATPTKVESLGTDRGTDFRVSGGTQNGGNLFHSFRDFTIGQNDSATFTTSPTTPSQVENILARVTGVMSLRLMVSYVLKLATPICG